MATKTQPTEPVEATPEEIKAALAGKNPEHWGTTEAKREAPASPDKRPKGMNPPTWRGRQRRAAAKRAKDKPKGINPPHWPSAEQLEAGSALDKQLKAEARMDTHLLMRQTSGSPNIARAMS